MKISKYILFIFSLVLLCNFTGCTSKKSQKELLIGSWKIDNLSFSNGTNIKNKKAYQEMLESFKENSLFSFNEDLTYVGKLEDIVVQSGTWSLDSETGIIILKSSQPENQSILHDTVHIESVDEKSMSLSLKEDEGEITAHFLRIE